MRYMDVETHLLSSIPAGENPFKHDEYHMGTPIGANILIMHANHVDEECKYIILVNRKSGKRIKIRFTEEFN